MVYKDCDIGSAKPNKNVLAKYPHHLVDIICPNEVFTVADFYRRSMDDVVFTCDMGLEIKELIDNSLKTNERVNLPVLVTATVPSISDEVVAKFTLTSVSYTHLTLPTKRIV